MYEVFSTAYVVMYTLRFFREPVRVQILTWEPYYQDGIFRLCRALLYTKSSPCHVMVSTNLTQAFFAGLRNRVALK